MANEETSFPKIPEANWWKLRDLFNKKVPAAVTASYLASALSMAESSAKANLIAPFKKIGIIEEDGKPTDLAYDWRDDNKYPDVCKTLLSNLYPQEVRDLFHSSDVDFQQLTNWFMNSARCGEPAAKMYARFYVLLLKADPKGGVTLNGNTKNTKSSEKITPKQIFKQKRNTSTVPTQTLPVEAPLSPPTNPIVLNNAPELHINIQLHISPESSADQIDKIFESMAKHLKGFNE